jgi:CheY-like chemotaxis protein/anti-sigma regulatory factor (Ser/Thr protein kinase)
LRGNASLLREREVIERQTQLLSRLVDDLLDVSRIARGKIQLRKQTVQLARIVANAIEVVFPLIEQRRHTLDVDVPSSDLPVEGDPVRLEQVIVNLLTNAAKYTPHGGNIRIIGGKENGQVHVRVRDDGAGIAPELLPRIFDLFLQGSPVFERPEGGLGIGLAIVKSLVRLHGGTIEARSEGAGRGSEFVVRLPLARLKDGKPLDETASGPETRQAEASFPRRRILIVDDNRDAADTLAELLEGLGHLLEVAYDGPSALRIAAETNPEIVIIDIGLPMMDGYEVARRLKAIPELGGARLFALTGYGQESDRRRALEAGFEDHFVKPVDLDRLRSILGAAR